MSSKKEISKNIFHKVIPQDLVKFGIVPELVGRLPVITVLDELDEEALVRILTEPKNALLRQYKKLFDYDDISFLEDKMCIRDSYCYNCYSRNFIYIIYRSADIFQIFAALGSML